MASLDKSSVRQEVVRLKTEFEQLRTDTKISPEIQAIMNSLFMMVELILAIFLEKTTPKTSANSSIPSSQTAKDDSSLGQSGRNGKGKRTQTEPASHTRTVKTVIVSHVDTCHQCGEDLSDIPCSDHERRTKIDIVFEKVIEHVDAEIKPCPTCHASVKGGFPTDMPGALQYGAGLKAFVINLLISQMVALHRVQSLVSAMMDIVISEATLLNFVLRCHQRLENWEAQMVERLIQAPVLHVDETSLRVDQKNHWIHVYSSGDMTLKFCHQKRGKEAIEAINIIPRYGGPIIHDCWASYLAYDHCEHGLCGSHLLRELTFVVEAQDYRWARAMKRLLQIACLRVSKRPEKCLGESALRSLHNRYRAIIACAENEMPEVLPKTNGKRGKLAKSDAHNLCDRLKQHENAVLLFAKNPQVPFTNNRAEQDLRMTKVKQKVSGCFRSELYAHAFCRISSYLQSMANQGYNPLIAIQFVLAGNIPELTGE
jgi:transposase